MTTHQIMAALRRLTAKLERTGVGNRAEIHTLIEAHNYIERREASDLRFKMIDHIDGNPRNMSIENIRIVDIRE